MLINDPIPWIPKFISFIQIPFAINNCDKLIKGRDTAISIAILHKKNKILIFHNTQLISDGLSASIIEI